jgi:DNA-binding transcriptional LysR family regulator
VLALRRVFAEEREYDPRTSNRTFRVAITDGVGYVLLPGLLRSLDRGAPGIAMQFLPIPVHPVVEDLIAGGVDLAVTYFGELPASVRRERLYLERYVALVASENRLVGRSLDAEAFRQMSHVAVESRPGAFSKLDALLRERGIERGSRVVVPHFLLVPHAVVGTQRVVTLGERLARSFATVHPLRVVELGFDLPNYEISQIWHERHENDPGIAWLRREVARAMKPARPRPRRHARGA